MGKSASNKTAPTPPNASTVNWREIAQFLLPAVLALLVYAVMTKDHGFVLDDGLVLQKHRHVQNGMSGISKIMSTNYASGYQDFNDGLYRPLSLVTFAIEKDWFDLDPSTSHIIQSLLYALSILMLILWLRELFDPKSTWPFWIAMLFALHPIHTEVAANLKSRDEIMAFLFFCAAAWCFTRWLTQRDIVWLVCGVLSYLLATFSKESAITFLAIFPLIAWYKSSSLKNGGIGMAAMLVPAIIFLLVRASVLGPLGDADSGVSSLLQNPLIENDGFGNRLGTAASIQGLYLQKLFLPFQLSHDYSYNAIPVVGLSSLGGLFWLLVNAALIGLGIWGAVKKRWWAFGILFYYVTVAVVANLVILIGAMAGERFLFSPALGWAIAVVAAIRLIPMKARARSWVLAGVCGILFWFTVERIPDWETNYTLFSTDVERVPNSARAQYNAGTSMNDEALEQPREAVELRNQAVVHLRKAIEIWPDYQDAYNNLGITLMNATRYEEAHEVFTDFIRLYPDYMKARYNMGSLCNQMKRYDEAELHFERFLEANPQNNQVLYMLAEAEGYQNKFDEAMEHLRALIELEPNNDRGYVKLAMAHAITNNVTEAEKLLDQAIEINGRNVDSRFNRGLIYMNTGRSDQARQEFEAALKINPNFDRAKGALQQLSGGGGGGSDIGG